MLQYIGKTDFTREFGDKSLCMRLLDGPLDLAWHHCGTTSDFISTFFAEQSKNMRIDAQDARHSIAYLVNEILENAVKFRSSGDIVIDSAVEGERFITRIANTIDHNTASRFQEILAEIESRDPGEFLVERIEQNALDMNSIGSGLGLLTLMSDYGAELGWKFEAGGGKAPVRLETHAALALT